MSKCPYCDDFTTTSSDPRVAGREEVEHMKAAHPEEIARRMKEAGLEPDDLTAVGLPPNLSQELDEIPTLKIMATVKAVMGANEMADKLLDSDPKMKAYVAWHGEVADALVRYCERRVAAGRP